MTEIVTRSEPQVVDRLRRHCLKPLAGLAADTRLLKRLGRSMVGVALRLRALRVTGKRSWTPCIADWEVDPRLWSELAERPSIPSHARAAIRAGDQTNAH